MERTQQQQFRICFNISVLYQHEDYLEKFLWFLVLFFIVQVLFILILKIL